MKHLQDMEAFESKFIQISRADAQAVGQQYSQALTTMYQGLRTIARLPGTRNIDRYANNLSSETIQSIQEIYNNLYDNVNLSEIYIVPVGFDPDKIDPNTGNPETPTITFDEFIVGKLATEISNFETIVEEVEIHEYRLMKKQIQWMKNKYPTESKIKSLNYPAISGEEVITCDNSMYSPTQSNDQDRSGLVYSVPFYTPNGDLGGIITGVILTNQLRMYLPNNNYVINNSSHDYMVTPPASGPWINAVDLIQDDKPDSSLIYSEVFDLGVTDSEKWRLWVGISDSEFFNLPHVKSERRYLVMALIAIVSITITVFVLIHLQQKEKITNQKLANANRAKTEFLARMSHELRTPLNAIIGYSEIVIDQINCSDDLLLNDCEKIHDAGTHLLRLINDILDVEKIEAGQIVLNIEIFQIDAIMRQLVATVNPLIIKNNNLLLVEDMETAAPVKADELKLKQILLNILSNAAKFTQNGKITLKIRNEELNHQHWVVFEVKDTGIGIAPDKICTIFEEFTQADTTITRNYEGTGLGLTISKRFCELMGGYIEVESVVNSGSTFTIWIPSGTEQKNKFDTSAVA